MHIIIVLGANQSLGKNFMAARLVWQRVSNREKAAHATANRIRKWAAISSVLYLSTMATLLINCNHAASNDYFSITHHISIRHATDDVTSTEHTHAANRFEMSFCILRYHIDYRNALRHFDWTKRNYVKLSLLQIASDDQSGKNVSLRKGGGASRERVSKLFYFCCCITRE